MPESNKETPNINSKIQEQIGDNSTDETQNTEDSKNHNFLRKILIYIIAFLISVLIIISIFYIFNLFASDDKDKEAQITVETPLAQTNAQPNDQTNTQQPQTEQPQVDEKQKPQEEPKPEEKEYSFDFNNLDPDKLNEQLAMLTNKNIEQSKLEKLRARNEKKTLEQNNKDKSEESAVEENPTASGSSNETINEDNKDVEQDSEKSNTQAQNTGESNTQTTTNTQQNNNTNQASNSTTQQQLKTQSTQKSSSVALTNTQQTNSTQGKDNTTTSIDTNFIKLINVAKIKGELQKNFLDKVTAINPNVHLCRDTENIIELYFGPFDNDDARKELFEKLVNKGFKQAYEVEMTQEEFNKSCNY